MWTQDTRKRCGRSGHVGYEMLLRPFPPLLQRVEHNVYGLTHHARETGSSWGSYEGRLAAIRIFFDGGVDGVGENEKNHTFPVGAAWIMPTSHETGQNPKWETKLQVCCAMPRGTIVTHAERRAATEAVKAVVSIVKHGKVMFNLDRPGAGKSVESLRENSIS